MKPVCLIVGANSEVGISIAKKLLDSHQLILCWHSTNSRVVELSGIENVDDYSFDLSKEANVISLMSIIKTKYRHIDLLINCIGKNTKCADTDINEKIWDDVIESNLKPVFLLCKYYKQLFFDDEPEESCIINFSSTAGIRALPSSPHYITAKAGVIALSNYYAKILAPYVRVNVIAPGFIDTDKHKSEKYDSLKKTIPLKRFASIDEIVDTILYIYSCDYITSQVIVIDGGLIS